MTTIRTFLDPKKVTIDFDPKEGKTEQHHGKTVNINRIIAKYQKTGLIDHIATYEAVYADVSGADFQQAMNTVINAENMFADLPAPIRDYYGGDPAVFLDAVQTDEGVQELSTLLNPVLQGEPMPTPESAPEALSGPLNAQNGPSSAETTPTGPQPTDSDPEPVT